MTPHSGLLQLRTVASSFLLVAGLIALAAAIAPPRGVAQRVSAGADPLGATPTPPPCEGMLVTLLDENFDSVIPPALPPGWVGTNALGPPPLWVTSDSGVPIPPAFSLPNAALIDDPAVVSDKRLDSPPLPPSEFPDWIRLTFRHNYNFDADVNPNVGFDGGVLEISYDGITFRDVGAAGGAFVSNGYNRTIATDRGSPIAGRQAWSGSSGGFITTTVVLPPFVQHLRWRMASDTIGSNEGWRVDNVVVIECEGGPPGTPKPTPSPRPHPTPAPRPTP